MDDRKRCGEKKRHNPHWWGVDKNTDYWCDGCHYEPTQTMVEQEGKTLREGS